MRELRESKSTLDSKSSEIRQRKTAAENGKNLRTDSASRRS